MASFVTPPGTLFGKPHELSEVSAFVAARN
jgi:hypothetical protein